jgi:putative polyketide hydroxylase
MRRRGGDGPVSTLDLYERSLTLLCGPEGKDWHAAGRRIAQELGVPLQCHRIGDGPDDELRPEPGDQWCEVHGTAPDGAVLVRPDGFVAWRTEGPVPEPAKVLTGVVASVLRR